MGIGPKLEIRNPGQAKGMGINRLVHREDIKEKGIKDYGREQK